MLGGEAARWAAAWNDQDSMTITEESRPARNAEEPAAEARYARPPALAGGRRADRGRRRRALRARLPDAARPLPRRDRSLRLAEPVPEDPLSLELAAPRSTAALLLACDILQLSALLYLTGGLQNPFSILLIVPVMVSATTLDPRLTFGLGSLALAAVSLLAVFHLPLPRAGEPISMPLTYVAGVWVALVSGIFFMGNYAFRVAEESRQLAEALAATELVLAREQHLSRPRWSRRRRRA